MVLMTHAWARQQREEEPVIAENEVESGALPTPVESIGEDSEQGMINPGSSFDDTFFFKEKRKSSWQEEIKGSFVNNIGSLKNKKERDQVNMY